MSETMIYPESTWFDAREMRKLLVSEGWSCIDSYSKYFAPAENESAVYLFMLYHTDDYTRATIAYVGTAKDLKSRLSGHEVLRQMDRQDYWVCRWFKPTPVDELRAVKREHIQWFNPAWNIAGKRREVA